MSKIHGFISQERAKHRMYEGRLKSKFSYFFLDILWTDQCEIAVRYKFWIFGNCKNYVAIVLQKCTELSIESGASVVPCEVYIVIHFSPTQNKSATGHFPLGGVAYDSPEFLSRWYLKARPHCASHNQIGGATWPSSLVEQLKSLGVEDKPSGFIISNEAIGLVIRFG